MLYLLAILLVTSYVGHDDVRSAHRTGISNADLHRLKIIRVFLLAEIPFHEKYITQKSIENEHMHFNDIVQGNSIHFHCLTETIEIFIFLYFSSWKAILWNHTEIYHTSI